MNIKQRCALLVVSPLYGGVCSASSTRKRCITTRVTELSAADVGLGRHCSDTHADVGGRRRPGPTVRPTSAADVGLRLTQHRHCLRLQSSVGLLLNTVSQFGLVRAVNNKSGRHCTNTLVIDSTYLYSVFGLLIMKTIMSLNR